MVENSYTRVTLALDIVRKIPDGPFAGYHELGIIKHKIDLHDRITIEESDEMKLECDNDLVPCDERNICWKAAVMLKEKFGVKDNVLIQIEKNIPVMGGLAGGSANAATTLSMLNRLWELKLTDNALMELGRGLGMDVPFYFTGNTAFDTEATGVVEPVKFCGRFTFVLAVPAFGVSTKDAYQGIDYSLIGKSVSMTSAMKKTLSEMSTDSVYPLIHNDFELTVFKKHPHLQVIKKQLIDAGCHAAVMSGSGSTVLGIARDQSHAEKIKSSIECKVIIASSLNQK